MKNIVFNSIKTPDGTVLISRHQHDYVIYLDANGETYMVDGGTGYLKRNVNSEPFEELSIYSDAPHDEIRQGFYWGTRGKDGNQPVEFKPLKTLDTDHIEAIIQTQTNQPSWRIEIFKAELAFRKKSS
ncbi:hypothetical protein C9J12_28145 [Photobacterium frigidiphilum]|uniref:Uncharacterized protein n=1 Tax=Photobacterium frigidiphilum TaxID=264736 RepID=A0A2T3J6L3_9GAMM|nr:hypothetical protein [Photobacterium frigidiphilum]PSU43454.1 hypothetical protein C9J12_28145 [Photobacterium frigidiphilum]